MTRSRSIVVAIATAMAAETAAANPMEIGPRDKFAWSCYMICFPVSRDFTGAFFDRPLDRPPSGGAHPRLVDLRNAIDAGFDGLSVDLFIKDRNALPAFQQLVSLVNEHRLPIGLSPMFDGFGRPGVTTDDAVKKVRAWFERFVREPCVVRCEGKPVVLTYAAYRLSPNQWRAIFARLREANCDGYWAGEFGRYLVPGTAPRFDKVRPWLHLFPAANTFPPMSQERTEEVLSLYRNARPNGRWVGSTRIGYWRPEVAVYAAQHGTRTFRESWRTIAKNGINWVQQATWNDFSENHHIMPSENYSTTFAELNRYLMRQWKGQNSDLARPKLFLSRQQEVCTGEEALFELLALLRPADVPARFELRLVDGAGKDLKSFGSVSVAKPGLRAVDFVFPVESIPNGRVLIPEAELRTSGSRTPLAIRGSYTIVSSSGYRPERNYSWLHTPADRQMADVQCELLLGGKKGESHEQAKTERTALIRASSPVPLADVEVLHSGVQVYSLLRHAPEASLETPVEHRAKLPINRRGLLDWGPYAVRAVTKDGRIVTSRPVFVERPAQADVTVGLWTFDSDIGADVFDDSPWLHDGRLGGRPRYEPHRPRRVADPWGGKCLSFDGIDDRVLLEGPIVPPNRHTVECWLKWRGFAEGKPHGQLIFAAANGVVVLGVAKNGALRATRKSGGKWAGVRDNAPLAQGEWCHAAVTCDGSALRLFRNGVRVGEAKTLEANRCGQVSVGYNSVTNGSFFHGLIDEVRVSATVLDPEGFGPHNPLSGRPH